jgi:hypothetical protein
VVRTLGSLLFFLEENSRLFDTVIDGRYDTPCWITYPYIYIYIYVPVYLQLEYT